jgi:hypothetical protein
VNILDGIRTGKDTYLLRERELKSEQREQDQENAATNVEYLLCAQYIGFT